MDETFDAIIIGGGAAGMSSAWRLRDKNILLLESSERLGGRIKSVTSGEYWLNSGAHLFPGAGSAIHEMITGLGLQVVDIPGLKTGVFFNEKVWLQKRIESYPLVLPLTIRERVAFARAGLRLLAMVKRWQRVAKERPGESEDTRRQRIANYGMDRSFRDVLGELPPRVAQVFDTAGRRASCELEEQSAAVGAALFGSHWSGDHDSHALNLLGGSGRLSESMTELLGDRVRFGASVTHVRELDDGVEVTYVDGDGEHVTRAQHAIVATPAPVARAIVQGLPPAVDTSLAAVRYGQFCVLTVETTEHTRMPWDDVYAITTPGLAFSMFFNHANPLRSGPRKPGGSLMCYAGGDSARRAMELSDPDIEELFMRDLYRLYPQLRDIVGRAWVQRWPIGGQYREPGDTTFKDLLQYVASDTSRIRLAGDYFAPLGQMEVAAKSGADAAHKVLNQL
jgi:oxygen-dependent protoporphyrinogen oxidase